ncbi:hypothetical protein BKA61DRAFT_672035 [Leptodontidium sp. MPI-SDFR-AT-0119]|nr:hypothetical protein BKA61DRAFT_672035 [Leptodontidium sp. MPI-SDFR-AT-0119]
MSSSSNSSDTASGSSQIATISAANSKRRRRGSKEAKFEAASFENDPTLFVTFLVGPNAVEFRIHREVIYQQCNVFKAAFESTMIEGQTQTYTLPDISEQCFSLFVQWTYAQKLNLFQLAKGYVHDEEATAEEDAENMALVEL